jgi:hypothetical protein
MMDKKRNDDDCVYQKINKTLIGRMWINFENQGQ